MTLAASHEVVPVWIDVLGDRETAVSVFERLVGDNDGFLLESVEGGERWARWSFVGWRPEVTLVSQGGTSRLEGSNIDLSGADPLEALEIVLQRHRTAVPDDAPPFYAGGVGYLSYDCVRYVEHLPDPPPDDRGLPEMVWMFPGFVVALDRFAQTLRIFRNVYVGDHPEHQYDEAAAELGEVVDRLGHRQPYTVHARPRFDVAPEARSNTTKAEFITSVERAVDYINAGDAFQIVPSLRLEADFDGDPFAVYRALRLVNPSPFLFFVRRRGLSIAGSSPELMSRLRDGQVTSRPIAGTRPRGLSPREDEALAAELLADPKERAEHVMLVDLARNDLGRVCEFGSITVDELMVIERYSHVMHIVSGVSGRIRDGLGPVDVLRATFPHGTVSGAPKVRAMEIIDELEPTARGPYAGAVGYVDFSGNLDTAIALRTLVIAGGKAWVQAGAGIVADSVAVAEYEECLNKAAAALAAIGAAGDV